ncbi:MAG: FtsW/RodA/SpoVE family cell cycle protein, partial [Actinobacteria bacterium]|nr:FtsW/RodA/SpoVE family cell cycle protein [Actinomycetota bacterium]
MLAAVITGAAYTLAALGKNATLPARIGPFLGSVLALLLIAHVAVRRLARGASPLLLPIAAL